jgi:hypothetical protein
MAVIIRENGLKIFKMVLDECAMQMELSKKVYLRIIPLRRHVKFLMIKYNLKGIHLSKIQILHRPI